MSFSHLIGYGFKLFQEDSTLQFCFPEASKGALFFQMFFFVQKNYIANFVSKYVLFLFVIHTFEFFKVRWSHSNFNMPPPPPKDPQTRAA